MEGGSQTGSSPSWILLQSLVYILILFVVYKPPRPSSPTLSHAIRASATFEKVFMSSLFQRICSMLAQTGQQAPDSSERKPDKVEKPD